MKLLIKAIVSLLLIGYCVLLYIFGNLVATAGISVFIFGCLYEFYGLCEKLQLKPLKILGLSVTCCLICEAYINNLEGMLHILLLAVFLTFLIVVLNKNHGHNAFLDG
ncbi:MAG: hypothetical protein ABRQ37_14375, partial [Candidatus Eremiobacterota bacterium]